MQISPGVLFILSFQERNWRHPKGRKLPRAAGRAGHRPDPASGSQSLHVTLSASASHAHCQVPLVPGISLVSGSVTHNWICRRAPGISSSIMVCLRSCTLSRSLATPRNISLQAVTLSSEPLAQDRNAHHHHPHFSRARQHRAWSKIQSSQLPHKGLLCCGVSVQWAVSMTTGSCENTVNLQGAYKQLWQIITTVYSPGAQGIQGL